MLQPLLVDGIKVLLLVVAGPCLGHPLQELVHTEWGGAAAGHAWDVGQVTWQVEAAGNGINVCRGEMRGATLWQAQVQRGHHSLRGFKVLFEPCLGSEAGHQAEATILKVCRLAEDVRPSGRSRQDTGSGTVALTDWQPASLKEAAGDKHAGCAMRISRNGPLQQSPIAGWWDSRVCKELTLDSSLSNGIDSVRMCWPVDRGAGLPLNARELQAPGQSLQTSGNMHS